MAKLACPCGNVLWNSCDGDEKEYYFVENSVLEAHLDDFAFFELECNTLATEIWKCDICDRMMVFDDPCGPVSRYMRRVDAESLGNDELAVITRAASVSTIFCSTMSTTIRTPRTSTMGLRSTRSSATPGSPTGARCTLAAS